MLEQPLYAQDDLQAARALVRAHAWAMLVTALPGGVPVVSHLPVLLDPARDDLTLLGHLAGGDAELHELGQHPAVVVVEGANGYISPTWYEAGPYVPTWDFVVLHLHGTPEVLGPEESYEVLAATVAHFEAVRPEPWKLESVGAYAHRIAPGATSFRLAPTRVVHKAKLSQDKPAEVVRRVSAALENAADPHHNPALAEALRRALPEG
ncbi:FMN-binding negative transcriptional regulator [Yinghuangia soli]|uniref:FMN-binding negative transcriptional regulator n=1 Tax=Yinghuangia soli TaxID=2908204 RepID=A0AA41U8Z0_9ACTN|nr:FMN-binding negative transcriptional regulator [Yinghuangia soli]MCF2533369.1 FMN-binding negative transcriptional regulator [Yinghuangia soli]